MDDQLLLNASPARARERHGAVPAPGRRPAARVGVLEPDRARPRRAHQARRLRRQGPRQPALQLRAARPRGRRGGPPRAAGHGLDLHPGAGLGQRRPGARQPAVEAARRRVRRLRRGRDPPLRGPRGPLRHLERAQPGRLAPAPERPLRAWWRPTSTATWSWRPTRGSRRSTPPPPRWSASWPPAAAPAAAPPGRSGRCCSCARWPAATPAGARSGAGGARTSGRSRSTRWATTRTTCSSGPPTRSRNKYDAAIGDGRRLTRTLDRLVRLRALEPGRGPPPQRLLHGVRLPDHAARPVRRGQPQPPAAVPPAGRLHRPAHAAGAGPEPVPPDRRRHRRQGPAPVRGVPVRADVPQPQPEARLLGLRPPVRDQRASASGARSGPAARTPCASSASATRRGSWRLVAQVPTDRLGLLHASACAGRKPGYYRYLYEGGKRSGTVRVRR